MPPHDPSPYQYPYPALKPSNHYYPPSTGTPTTATTPSTTSATLPLTHGTQKDPEHTQMLQGARTPSPTPSEERALKTSVLDWKTLSKWRFWIRREWLWYYVALVVILVVTALITIYHKQIVHWLTPVTRWLHDLRFGWLVPIGVLFVISFPPLFGHEIVAILCGLVWGLWVGFAIVSAGTFLGEVGNFYAFKYCCRARGEKLERTKITYACLAKVVRDGGFKIALIARLSAIPGHFTTAVFSTCGMGIFVFSLAAILSMPKQFITVYLGVILEQSSTGVKDKKSTIISDVVLGVTVVITFAAMWYIYRRMDKVKVDVVRERRKARQAKFARAGLSPYITTDPASSTTAFDPYANTDNDSIPLKVQAPSVHSSHESSGFTNHNRAGELDTQYLYAPQPRKSGRLQLPSSDVDVELESGYAYGRPSSRGSNSNSNSSEGHDDERYRYYGHKNRTQGGSSSMEELGWELTPVQHTRVEDMYGYRPDRSVDGRSRNASEDTLRVADSSPPPVPALAGVHSSSSASPPEYQPNPNIPSPVYLQQHQQQHRQQQQQALAAGTTLPPPAFPPPPGRPGSGQDRQAPAAATSVPGRLYDEYDGYGYGHGQEPTDASYRTARESSSG